MVAEPNLSIRTETGQMAFITCSEACGVFGFTASVRLRSVQHLGSGGHLVEALHNPKTSEPLVNDI